jgi:hypothetical protein
MLMNKLPLSLALFAMAAGCATDPPAQNNEAPGLGKVDSPNGINVNSFKELMIVHPSVVADPVRTSNVTDGHWSFRWLMEQLSHDSGLPANQFVEAWLEQFRVTQVPGTSIALRDRPGVDDLLARWPKDETGHIDLSYSPFRLLSIVNRIDKGTTVGDMGEGRFVFGLIDPDAYDPTQANPMSMTVIFEFHQVGQPKTGPKDQKQRQKNAMRWHALGSTDFGESFNQQLQNITDAFVTTYGPASLNQLRTDEIALGGATLLNGQPGPEAGVPWELREFHLVNGQLTVAPVQATAGDEYNNDPTFAQFLLDNQADVLAGTVNLGNFIGYTATEAFSKTRWQFPDVGGQPFPEATRFAFAKGTCNGCHNAERSSFPAPQFPEGATLGFYHITPFPTEASPGGDLDGTERVSPFLKEIDLPRRATFMQNILFNANSTMSATPLAD